MMQRRKLLVLITASFAAVGIVAAIVPFVSSLSPSAAVEKSYTVDLSDMEPGSVRKLKFRDHPVWVLRRTAEMEKVQGLIPKKVIGEQRYWAMSKDEKLEGSPYRSYDSEYFVFLPEAGYRNCQIRFTNARPVEVDSEYWASGFLDPCTGHTYDTAGRNYSYFWGWYLYVPEHSWKSKGVLQFGT